jgi:hypothetical protein
MTLLPRVESTYSGSASREKEGDHFETAACNIVARICHHVHCGTSFDGAEQLSDHGTSAVADSRRKKVFVGNTGAGFDSSAWSRGSDRIYNEFYAALKSGGRFELVTSPSEADLVLNVNVIPSSAVWQFKLDILDPKTGIVLWTVYEPTKITVSQKARDKNFDDAINKLASDLSLLTNH